MPVQDLLPELGVLPLRAIVFQSLLLLVSIALEAAILRQRLRIGYHISMQYAATINLMATSLGWFAFLLIESLLPQSIKMQVMSYILFNRFYENFWQNKMLVLVILLGIVAFFLTFWIKLKGLEWLLACLGRNPVVGADKTAPLSRKDRYALAREGSTSGQQINSARTLAILEANAASFGAILGLLLLRHALGATL
jgi:hypothetical protein